MHPFIRPTFTQYCQELYANKPVSLPQFHAGRRYEALGSERIVSYSQQ